MDDYPVYIEEGGLARLGERCRAAGLGGPALVVSDSNVGPLYGERALAALRGVGYRAALAPMPAGEAHKTLQTVEGLSGAGLAAGLERAGFIVALGGGVVGDTAGLLAALYMRGVDLAQVPTSLLAMVDSSIGGKVGVDHPAAKNLIGAFKTPAFVLADPQLLTTLPAAEVRNGLAEIIKAAIIAGEEFMARLETAPPPPIASLIGPAIAAKQRIVEADPYEQGQRALLNLGHTFGHAFEQVSGYRRPHGVGVGQGVVAATHLARILAGGDTAWVERVTGLVARHGLPTRWGGRDLPPATTPDDIMAAMAGDKKRRAGRLRFILPLAPGDVRIADHVPLAAVRAALEQTQ